MYHAGFHTSYFVRCEHTVALPVHPIHFNSAGTHGGCWAVVKTLALCLNGDCVGCYQVDGCIWSMHHVLDWGCLVHCIYYAPPQICCCCIVCIMVMCISLTSAVVPAPSRAIWSALGHVGGYAMYHACTCVEVTSSLCPVCICPGCMWCINWAGQ